MGFYQDGGRGVVENRRRFFEKAGIDPKRTVMPDIVHGNEVAVITGDDLGKDVLDLKHALQVDGLVSYVQDSTLAMDTGDCPVILFSSKDGSMIGLAHAGWRSLDGGIVGRMVQKIKEKTPSDAIEVTIGVGICPECYRFPKDMDHPLLTKPEWQAYRVSNPDGTVGIDLDAYIKEHLTRAGVRAEHIHTGEDVCTSHSQDPRGQPRFYSHRRASKQGEDQAQREGRFITFVHLPKGNS